MKTKFVLVSFNPLILVGKKSQGKHFLFDQNVEIFRINERKHIVSILLNEVESEHKPQCLIGFVTLILRLHPLKPQKLLQKLFSLATTVKFYHAPTI